MKYFGGAVAGGYWLSADFDTWDINGGLYYSYEWTPPKIGAFNPSFGVGVESTIFASPNYQGALKGSYDMKGANYNNRTLSSIRAADGDIHGLQFTHDFFGRSLNDIKHDTSAFHTNGEGDILWSWKNNDK